MRFKLFWGLGVLLLLCISITGFYSMFSDIDPETRQLLLPLSIATLTLAVGVFMAIFPLNQLERDSYAKPGIFNWIGALVALGAGWMLTRFGPAAVVGTDVWWDLEYFGGNTDSHGHALVFWGWFFVTFIISYLSIWLLRNKDLYVLGGNYHNRQRADHLNKMDEEFDITTSPNDPPDPPKSFDTVVGGIIDHLKQEGYHHLAELIERWAKPHPTGILPADSPEVKKEKTTAAARKGFCTALWNLRERQLRTQGSQTKGPIPATFTEEQEWELLMFGEELIGNFLAKQKDKLVFMFSEMEIAPRLTALRDVHESMIFPNNAGGDITFMAAFDEAHAAGLTAFRATPPSDNLPWASVLVSFAKLFETGKWHGPQTVPANFFQLEAFRRFTAELAAGIPVLRLEKARKAFIELVTKRGLAALASSIAGKSALDFGKWVWESHCAAVEEAKPLPEVARVEGRKELADGVDEILAKREEFIEALQETFEAKAQTLRNSVAARAKARGLLKLEADLTGIMPVNFALTVVSNFANSTGSVADFSTANAKGRKALIEAAAKILGDGDNLKKAFPQFKMADEIDALVGAAHPVPFKINSASTTLPEALKQARQAAIDAKADPYLAITWYAQHVVKTGEGDQSGAGAIPSGFTMDKGFADLKALCGPEGWAILKKWEDGVTFIRSKAKNGKLNADIGRAMNLTDADESKHLSEAEAAWKTIDGSLKPKSVLKDRQRAFLLKLHERLSAPEQKQREGRPQPPAKKS